MGGVAPDGSPVAIYLALPAGDVPELVDAAVAPRGSILELGSGPGRVTRPLVELGHPVVAVDNSPEMLRHIDDIAETVLADLFTLDLGRSFDGVVAASNLVNNPGPEQRASLLAVCARHAAPDGVVLIERYPPQWAAEPTAAKRRLGPVDVTFEPLATDANSFRGRVTYHLGDDEWSQEFSAANVTDEMLGDAAAAAGLRLDGWLDDARTWALLLPA